MANMIVQGVFVLDPGERDRYLEASLDSMRSVREEEGCIEYVFAADPLDPSRVVLSERWESLEHLQQHLKLMRSRPRVDRPKAQSSEVTIFEVVSTPRLS